MEIIRPVLFFVACGLFEIGSVFLMRLRLRGEREEVYQDGVFATA